MTLLIADDNVRMRETLRRLLTHHFTTDITIHECADGLDAVASAQMYHPDWILMDIKMEHLDGLAAAKAILLTTPQSKIIIVTSYDEPEFREEAEKIGVTGYVLKDNLFSLLDIFREYSQNNS